MMNLIDVIRSGNATIIDVRDPVELIEGKIPGSINIPVNEIVSRMDEIRQLPGPIVLYCRSGNRSGRAISIIRSAGLEKEMYKGGGYYDMLSLIN